MKKFIGFVSVIALSASLFGMAKAPQETDACSMEKSVKDAACSTEAQMSCCEKSVAAGKTPCCAMEVVEKVGCAGGTCPLSK